MKIALGIWLTSLLTACVVSPNELDRDLAVAEAELVRIETESLHRDCKLLAEICYFGGAFPPDVCAKTYDYCMSGKSFSPLKQVPKPQQPKEEDI